MIPSVQTAALTLLRPTAQPQARTSSAARIHDDLRQRILSMDLPPGTALPRADLARHYEVSQTPLRDALQLLERDDLVQIRPQSRTVVTRIDIARVHRAHFLRTALETEVARHLAGSGAPDVVAQGRAVIEAQRGLTADVDGNSDKDKLRLFQELDEYFHRVLFEGAGQHDLHDLVRSRAGHMDRVRRLQVHSPAKIAGIIDGHNAILDTIAACDEPGAIRAMRDHLRRNTDWVDAFRDRHPDHFT